MAMVLSPYIKRCRLFCLLNWVLFFSAFANFFWTISKSLSLGLCSSDLAGSESYSQKFIAAHLASDNWRASDNVVFLSLVVSQVYQSVCQVCPQYVDSIAAWTAIFKVTTIIARLNIDGGARACCNMDRRRDASYPVLVHLYTKRLVWQLVCSDC